MSIKNNQKIKDKRLVRKLFLESLAAIFIVETLVMLTIHAVTESLHSSPIVKGLVDSISLCIFLLPAFFFSFYRPFLSEMNRRAEAEKMRRTAQIQYATVLCTSIDGFWMTDIKGNFLDVNDTYCRLIGYSRDELLRMSIQDVEAEEKSDDVGRHIKKIKEAGGDHFETKHKSKDGKTIDIEVSVNYLKDPDERLCVFLRDITERKRFEEELIASNRELVKLDRLKSEFIAMVSHELRTPIGVMQEGVSQVVDGLRGEISAEQRQCLGKSLSHMERLTKIVNSILEIANLEAGKIGLRMESVNITEVAGEIIRIFEPLAKNKDIEIRAHFLSRGEPMCSPEKIVVLGDKNKLGQVFTGLMDNAVKFTEKGHIEIQIVEKADSVECSVADTGKGMPAEALPKAFDKFEQFGREYGPGEKGVGLGLPISKGIIELHKGKIWIESEMEKGTRVSFSLPKGIP